jgi:hypothetical protein
MFGSQILEVALGLAFLYFIFSLIASAVMEAVASFFALRAKTLQQGLLVLLDPEVPAEEKPGWWVRLGRTIAEWFGKARASGGSPELAKGFFKHGLIANLGRVTLLNPNGSPSYVPAQRFSRSFLEALITLDGDAADTQLQMTSARIQASIQGIGNPIIKQTMGSFFNEIEEDITSGAIRASERVAALRGKVENWFDETMERVGGWYKRKAQAIIFISAFLIALGLNVDSVMVTNTLWTSPAIRSALANSASAVEGGVDELDPVLTEIGEFQLLGWAEAGSDDPRALPTSADTTAWYVYKIIGLLITAFALSLGAPFWFQMLTKIVNLRGSGSKPEDSEPDGTADSAASGEESAALNRELNSLQAQLQGHDERFNGQLVDIILDKISDRNPIIAASKIIGRGLHSREIEELQKIFGDRLNYDAVRIYEGTDIPNLLDDIGRVIKDMPARPDHVHNAITFGNLCFFGREIRTDNIRSFEALDGAELVDMKWLVHELTHVWQYQTRGWSYLWQAWESQRTQKEGAYHYGGKHELKKRRNEGARFADYNPEQQGRIMEDYYAELKGGASPAAELAVFEGFVLSS